MLRQSLQKLSNSESPSLCNKYELYLLCSKYVVSLLFQMCVWRGEDMGEEPASNHRNQRMKIYKIHFFFLTFFFFLFSVRANAHLS